MRILICDDDAHLRTVLFSVLTERGHEVVAEADTAADAYSALARSKPDVAIVDLALRAGSGRDVARDASSRGCRVVVFSAYVDDIDTVSLGVIGVMKPDFAALEQAIDALASTRDEGDQWCAGQADRRATAVSAGRPVPMSPVEDPDDFYRALGEAHPGDTLMLIEAASPDEASTLAVTVRAVIRTQDHLMQRGSQLTVLLVDGLPNAADAVNERLARATTISWTERHAPLTHEEIPADAYQRLRST